MSDRNANSTHFGIGSLPVSHRATVVRWTPSKSERPDCVSPASVLSVTRVSGSTGIKSRLRLFNAPLEIVDVRRMVGAFGAVAPRRTDVGVGVAVRSLFGRLRLAVRVDEGECGHAGIVALRYNAVNTLYQTNLTEAA